MKRLSLLIVCLVLTLSSCIKDEPKNSECDIISAWVEGDQMAQLFYQPSKMRIENISSTESTIVFPVKSFLQLPDSIAVFFNVTPGATIKPASGTKHNFREWPVTYTVTSEDGAWQRQYTVAFKEDNLPAYLFSFENVETVKGINNNLYHEFYEMDQNGTRQNIWASGNAGAAIIKTNSQPADHPTYQTEYGYYGKGVCLVTQDAGQLGRWFNKPIAAGNLFMGRFVVEQVMTDPLKATEFGRPIDRVPVRVTGYYKYQPGETFTDKKMNVVEGKVDEASIYAVFFRNKDEQNNDICLYGDNVLSSPYIVRKAVVAQLPPTNEWTRFEMFFEGDDADPKVLAEQGYSMTLVFSSSKNGDSFEGAIGSRLYVDEVEVSFEETNDDKELEGEHHE